MTGTAIRLGLRANAGQFALLVALNAFVGAMVGLERSVLPLIGEDDFGLSSKSAILSFVVAFGCAKAFANLAAGGLATRAGRKRLLVLGWLFALPVPVLVALAPTWWLIVVANVFLGLNQGFAWSMTVVMKIDLVGPARRGLALGLNESAGYIGVAVTAFATGALAATYAPRTLVWVGAAVIAAAGTLVTLFFVRDTGPHVDEEQRRQGSAHAIGLRSAFMRGSVGDRVLRACSQAGLVNNLNDALAWGLAPLYLAANGASVTEVGIVAAAYPAVWGLGQLATGALSDRTGRKPLIVTGMLVQAAALALLVAGGGEFIPALGAAVLLGIGTALVYPALIAAVSDVAQPVDRAQLIGVYRFWRDFGFVVGAVVAGTLADAFGSGTAIVVVSALTAGSGIWVATTRWTPRPAPLHRTAAELLEDARHRIAPRLEGAEALAALKDGAALVDLRSQDERRTEGLIPGSIHVPRSVLEWRLDPASGYANPYIHREQRVIVFCAHGFSSSFAAATIRELGFATSTDLVGGFAAWREAGLPVREFDDAEELRDGELPGMRPAVSHDGMVEKADKCLREREVEMRAIDCPCGHHLEGADDEELVRLARQHVEEHHPDMERSDEQLRARVAADAYDV